MKKINRTRKRVLHKCRYQRFRELLIEKMCEVLTDTLDEVIINGVDDEKRFCRKCNFNDCDYGCTCPPNEEVYQCEMYMYYHPEEVAEFNKAMEEWCGKVGKE